ncbi:hypothetical protein [Mycobacterium sp. M26]|uniref:hypothetical protein n=1 Tax=Mycobacterium sp. M26 TaxID=1762962 RepID=UPI000AAA89C8|nr:hypothetical protein [Mycobacterium sp. M26]
MPTLARPVRDERHARREFLSYQQSALVADGSGDREVIHHGAEIACLRDLYTHSH